MNLSKAEQRTLHALAQGGRIRHVRNGHTITSVTCITRDGYALLDCTLAVFRRLKRRGLIQSIDSYPYRISTEGLTAVRPQPDNR